MESMVNLLRARGQLCKSRFPFISFYQVGPRDRPQVSWLLSGHLYPLSHCASSQSVCYECGQAGFQLNIDKHL